MGKILSLDIDFIFMMKLLFCLPTPLPIKIYDSPQLHFITSTTEKKLFQNSLDKKMCQSLLLLFTTTK